MGLYVSLPDSLVKFAADASGATAIEYALIVSGIAVAIITAVGALGDKLSAVFDDVRTALANR